MARMVLMAGVLLFPMVPAARAEPGSPPVVAAEPAGDAATFEHILAHPDSVDPFGYAQLVSWLWSSGRRQQATFWFYMLQARTRPWAQADHDGEGSGAAALRASLNEQLGSVVNKWVASDPAAWKGIVDRVLSFEAHLPLNDSRPDGMDAAAWQALVAKERAEYDHGAKTMFSTLNPADVAAQRKAAGLYNGPLQEPGPPLPDAWR